jgi:hypothetical protein
LAEETKKCIGGFINFLRNSESRGLKFKKE